MERHAKTQVHCEQRDTSGIGANAQTPASEAAKYMDDVHKRKKPAPEREGNMEGHQRNTVRCDLEDGERS